MPGHTSEGGEVRGVMRKVGREEVIEREDNETKAVWSQRLY